jgi:hypothetical protein
MFLSIPLFLFALVWNFDAKLIWSAVVALFSGAFFISFAETLKKSENKNESE